MSLLYLKTVEAGVQQLPIQGVIPSLPFFSELE